MKLQIKRIYDAPSPDDVKRIFVDRLWTRGLKKDKAQLDAWEKELTPSTGLRKWYGHDPEKFEEFQKRYLAARNILTPEGKRKWSISTIKSILSNENPAVMHYFKSSSQLITRAKLSRKMKGII